MESLNLRSNPQVKALLASYPVEAVKKMKFLRELILEAASELEGGPDLEETLKWGEPSYLTRHGSTLRMDWKEKSPDQYALYFKCTSKLVPTFRMVFGDLFNYEGNRAIIFKMDEPVPKKELKACIKAALRYHKVKHLPDLDLAP